jgi:hypothetical protein
MFVSLSLSLSLALSGSLSPLAIPISKSLVYSRLFYFVYFGCSLVSLQTMGAHAVDLGIAPDDVNLLRTHLLVSVFALRVPLELRDHYTCDILIACQLVVAICL